MKIDIIEELKKTLGVQQVKVFKFLDFDKKNHFLKNHFSETAIGWNANIIQADFQDFLNQPLDLLIAYFDTNHVYLEIAVLQSKATFKVGFSGVNQQLFDIEIAENPTNVDVFFTELKKYLLILKKIKN